MSQPLTGATGMNRHCTALAMCLAMAGGSGAIADLAAQSPQAQEDYVAGNAIPADSGVLLRPVADAPASDPARPSAQVRVRLDPGLGQWIGAVRAAVVASPAARIAEPAEYEIRTRRNFPLTLRLVNLWEPDPQGVDPRRLRKAPGKQPRCRVRGGVPAGRAHRRIAPRSAARGLSYSTRGARMSSPRWCRIKALARPSSPVSKVIWALIIRKKNSVSLSGKIGNRSCPVAWA